MQAPTSCQSTSVKPQGNFELVPELMDASEKRPLDVIYEYFVGRRESEEGGLINVGSQLLRSGYYSQVNVSCVDPSCELVTQLTFAPADAKALANLILQAVADAEAAFAVAAKQGGAA